MLLRLALAAVAGLSACSDEGPGVTVPAGPDTPGSPALPTLRQSADLPGAYADRIRIVGDGWRANGSGQEIVLTFAVDGLDRSVRQFEIVVEPEPATAFDLATATFTARSPPFLVPPFPGGIQLTGTRMRMGWAIFGEPVPPLAGTETVGTLTLRTSPSFGALTRARLVVTLLSVGPSSSVRDRYESGALRLGVDVN